MPTVVEKSLLYWMPYTMSEHDDLDLEAWLVKINAKYKVENEPARARPMKAIQDYAREFNCALEWRTSTNKKIMEFFESRSPPDTFSIGSIYKGAFFYDTYFWPLHVPVIFGEVKLNAYDTLVSMPEVVKKDIKNSANDHVRLHLHWADCMDYGYGIEEAVGKMSPEAATMLKGADVELAGAMALIENNGGNSRVMLSLRLAIEIFIKSFLVQELNLDENGLKKLGHNLSKLLNACHEFKNEAIFKVLEDHHSKIFPAIDARYQCGQFSPELVWMAVALSQSLSASVVRKYSARDLRYQVENQITLSTESSGTR